MHTSTMHLRRSNTTLTIERAFGAYVISAVIGNHREARTYFSYTRAECVARFRAEFSV